MNPAAGRFKPGDRVKVKFEDRPGRIRTPWYIRGKIGWVEGVYGDFRNPELLAYGRDGLPMRTLYPGLRLQRDLGKVGRTQRQGSGRYLRTLVGLGRLKSRTP